MQPISVLLIAAGASTRLGQPKQLVEVAGETLLRRTIRTALSIDAQGVVVVLGAFYEEINGSLTGLPVQVVHHAGWASGMGGSIACGLRKIMEERPDTEGILLLLCDQPYLNREILLALVHQWASSPQPVIAATYGGTAGPPVFFDRQLFGEILSLDPAKGAKPLLNKYQASMGTVDFAEGIFDVDTPEDLAKWQAAGSINDRPVPNEEA